MRCYEILCKYQTVLILGIISNVIITLFKISPFIFELIIIGNDLVVILG